MDAASTVPWDGRDDQAPPQEEADPLPQQQHQPLEGKASGRSSWESIHQPPNNNNNNNNNNEAEQTQPPVQGEPVTTAADTTAANMQALSPPLLEDPPENNSNNNEDNSNNNDTNNDDINNNDNSNDNNDNPAINPDDPVHTSVVRQVVDTVTVVLPKCAPLPWSSFVLLTLLVAMPSAAYVIFFTKLGFGSTTFYALAEAYGSYASTVGVATVGWFLLLYMMDANTWTSCVGVLVQRVSAALLVLGMALLVLFMTDDYPYGPICYFAFFTPLWLLVIGKGVCLSQIPTRRYVHWLSGPLFVVSVVVGIVWLIWTLLRDENEFNEATKVAFAQQTGCQPNLEDYPDCASNNNNNNNNNNNPPSVCFSVVESPPSFTYQDDTCDPACPSNVYADCLNGFILWAGPLLVSLVLFFLGFFCTFLRDESSERDIINFGKLWLFLLFAMWLTASLAGVAAGLSSALLALTLASFVGSATFVATTQTPDQAKAQATGFWTRLADKYGAYFDVGRGLFLVTCLPFVCVYVVLSFVNQLVRKLGLPCSKELKTEQTQKDFLTKRCRIQINAFLEWDRAKVYTFACYWGIAFMIMWVIVAEFTVLFLSWLIEQTSSMNLGAVTAILIGVGMLMFLLPPVPGVPIYFTLGVVVLATGRELLGLIGAMAYAAAVSLVLKLVACTAQQKLIGENLAQYTSIRKLVGINSTVIKAMRLVLAQKGMGLDKVSILVGGPDWPTSVLCGIMQLNLISVLFGTLPVIFLILPTMLTGSFTYMASLRTDDGALEFPSAGVWATVFASFTAVVQFGSMLFAAYFLEQTTSLRKEELDAIENDKEVGELEAKEEHFNRCYQKVTQWEDVPTLARITLTLALFYMVLCCYMVQMFANSCFAEYQLTYTIGEHLNGNALNLVLPLGWCAIALFFLSCILLYAFISWANIKAKALAEETSMAPAASEADYEAFNPETVKVGEATGSDEGGANGKNTPADIEMEYMGP